MSTPWSGKPEASAIPSELRQLEGKARYLLMTEDIERIMPHDVEGQACREQLTVLMKMIGVKIGLHCSRRSIPLLCLEMSWKIFRLAWEIDRDLRRSRRTGRWDGNF